MFKVKRFHSENNILKDSPAGSLIIAVLLTLIVALIEQKPSILIWAGIWLALGSLIVSISFPSIRKKKSLTIFYLFFAVYFLYSAVCNYFYVHDPLTDFFYAQDSLHFFANSNVLGQKYSIGEIIDASFTGLVSSAWQAFALISGIVALFANYLDVNNIIVQKLIVIFFSSLILPFVFNILCNYFDKKRAFALTIIYGLLSYSLFYSAVLVRDTPIGFFFVVLIYLFYTGKKLNKLPLFILISFIIFFFRPEHGIFSLIFLFAYLYIYLKDNNSKYKYFFVIPIIFLGGIAIGNEMDFFLNTINSTTNVYLENSLELADPTSLGALLLKLPWGFRQIAAGLFSQTMPFPFYHGLDKNGLGFIPLSIAALFWFFIWFVILQLLFKSKYRKVIDNKLWLLFLIASVLVLGASVNADTRRIMAVYPIFFVISMKVYRSISHVNRIKTIFFSAFTYLFFLEIYLVIKK